MNETNRNKLQAANARKSHLSDSIRQLQSELKEERNQLDLVNLKIDSLSGSTRDE